MVEMLDPKPTDTVGDPACGTAGFLVGVMLYLLEKYSSPKGIYVAESGEKVYTGDKLEQYRARIQNEMFHGFDFDSTMLRIASMNLMLHGVDNPDIHYQDTLSNSFPEKFPKQASGCFDVILANPPFKGSLDAEDVHPSLTQKVKTKKTELLFVALILEHNFNSRIQKRQLAQTVCKNVELEFSRDRENRRVGFLDTHLRGREADRNERH